MFDVHAMAVPRRLAIIVHDQLHTREAMKYEDVFYDFFTGSND